MKKLFLIKLLVIAALTGVTTSFADRNTPTPLLTNEQKQKEVDNLINYVEKQQKNIKRQIALKAHMERRSKNLCIDTSDEDCIYERKVHQREIKNQQNREQGRYRIHIAYINDNSFSHEYHFFEPPEGLSESAAREYEKEVFRYYLGANYKLRESELSLVTSSEVVMYFYAAIEELWSFLSDDRITYISTPANQTFESRP
ncbi:MAG: hypothetical protein ACRBHB_13670 [Arenicella sp.]